MSLMPDAFVLLAGEQARTDENTSREAHVKPSSNRPGCFDSMSLVEWQQRTYGIWSSVEVMDSIYGWYVRDSSGLSGWAIMAATKQRCGHLDGSYEMARDWAIAWVNERPLRRYAFVRKSALERAGLA